MADTTAHPVRDDETIQFANGRTAHVLKAPLGTSGVEIVKQLKQQGLQQPAGLILIFGGAGQIDRLSEHQRAYLTDKFSRGVAQAAADAIKDRVEPPALPPKQIRETTAHRLSLLLRRSQDKPSATAPAAPPNEAEAKRGIVIIDGGTNTGVMAMIGQGVADRRHRTTLIGVAPYHMVTYPGKDTADADSAPLEPNHTHFVLQDSHGWGSETETLVEIAEALETSGPTGEKIPVVAILAGGTLEGITLQETLHCVRHSWPVIVIEESGGLAEQIATLSKEKKAIEERRKRSGDNIFRKLWWLMNPQVSRTSDPALLEILDGKLRILEQDGSSDQLRRMIIRHLQPKQPGVLLAAWARFADYDKNAARQQRTFDQLQKWILGLGVVAVILAILRSQFPTFLQIPLANNQTIETLQALVVIVTVVLTGLVAYRNRFNAGEKYILLRSSAEAIKREIYPYRINAGAYSPKVLRDKKTTREVEFAHQIGLIGSRIMRTEVSSDALDAYSGDYPPMMYGAAGEDHGFSILTPEQYVAIRIGDQINYYRPRAVQLRRLLNLTQVFIFAAAGVSTLLAAFGADVWVPVATALAVTLTTYLEYRQIENTLIKYNQARTDLENLKAWWDSLSKAEKENQDHIDQLVNLTEQTLETEIAGWARRLQNALAELHKGKGESGQAETPQSEKPQSGSTEQNRKTEESTN